MTGFLFFVLFIVLLIIGYGYWLFQDRNIFKEMWNYPRIKLAARKMGLRDICKAPEKEKNGRFYYWVCGVCNNDMRMGKKASGEIVRYCWYCEIE